MSYSHHWTPPRSPWYGDRPGTGVPDGQLRVSDLERTEVTNALCRHFGDGRLDEAEFNDRMEKATMAKTRDDLAPLLIDLPPLDSSAATGRRHGLGGLDVATRRHRRIPPLLLVVVAAIVISSTLPLTFMAWHAHWLLLAVLAIILVVRRDRRRRIHT